MNDQPARSAPPVVLSMATADRRTTFAFYGAGLGFEAIGELAEDGVPEPLQFALNEGLRLMFIPTGGFGWVLGGRPAAEPGQSECVLNLPVATEAEVDQCIEAARQAGAEVITEPGPQPWGYAGTFADPDGHLWMALAVPPPAGGAPTALEQGFIV